MLVHEATYSEDVRQQAVDAFKKTVTSELDARVYAKHKFMEHVKHVTAPERALIAADPAAKAACKALEPLVAEGRAQFKSVKTALNHEGVSTFSITAHGGLTISVPPYDVQWTTGLFNDADMNAGTFTSRSIDSLGYQAAGLGIFVSTTIPGRVRFSADAEFHSRWTDLVIEGAATTEGGVGVLVYEGGNVIARSDAQLWSDTQSGVTLHGASGDDVTLLTQTRAGQTYFNMLPGRQYLVWVWSWTTAAILGNDLALGLIEAHMPFVVVEQQR
jgi:hypothetical protein